MNTRKSAITLAVGVGLVVGMVAGARAENTLKIGIIAPLTGPAAPWGLAMSEGAKIYARHYNAQGGLGVGGKQYQVEVIAYDDMYSAANALAAYNRLVNQDGVKYIEVAAGVSTMAVKRDAMDDKVVIMTAGYIAEELDPTDHYMYRSWGVPADYFPPLYDTLAKVQPERRVAIINPNDESARQASELAEASYKRNGYTVLSNELYERSLKDFLPLITKILGQNPDVVDLCTTAPAQAALLVRQFREFGYKGVIAVTGSTAWREIVAGAGKENAEGVINTLSVDPNSQSYKEFAAEYVKSVGQEPNDAMAGYASGFNAMLLAIQAGGAADDTSKFEEGFYKAAPYPSIQGDKMTVGGKARYGLNHQLNFWRYLGVIHNGVPEVVGKFQ